MAIKGLTEHRRLPRLGKIRIGIKKISEKTGKEYPFATDYFVLPENLTPFFQDNPHPKELPIMIPVEDDEIWCPQYYKLYSSFRGVVCKGDGEKCRRMVDKATGDRANRETQEVVWHEMECAGRECPDYKRGDCSEAMNLQFIMPDLPGLGVWQIDTKSPNSIRNINNAAAMIRSVYKHIAFIPLILSVEPAEVIDPKGQKKKVHLLNLRTNGTMKELMLQARQPITELLLPSPVDDEAPLDGLLDMPEAMDEQPESGPSLSVIPPPVVTSPTPDKHSHKTKSEPSPRVTKAQVDDAPPLTDDDFVPEAEEDNIESSVKAKGELEEGSDAWIIYMIIKLNISDDGVRQVLIQRYHIPSDKLSKVMGENLTLLKNNQREDLTKLLKNKAKSLAEQKPV